MSAQRTTETTAAGTRGDAAAAATSDTSAGPGEGPAHAEAGRPSGGPVDLNWRAIALGVVLCAVAAAATPYVTLKLGQSVDLTMGGMFLAAVVLGKRVKGRDLAIQLNVVQTMISVVSGIAFMVVILAAFHYIRVIFHKDIGPSPAPWQMFVWLFVSANLGVFMGAVPRKSILRDRSIPWPASRATLSVAQTLTDPAASESTRKRREALVLTTGAAGFLTFLRDGLGVITPIVGNATLNIAFGLELAAIGLGMLVPLSVGLSALLGTWVMSTYGERVARLAALSGVKPDDFAGCASTLDAFHNLAGDERSRALALLSERCGEAGHFVEATSHFKYVVQWMMWPATAMMVAAAVTGVLVPMVRNFLQRDQAAGDDVVSIADEAVPTWWTVTGLLVSVAALVAITTAWFGMPVSQVLLAVAIQPLLIVAGLRVLGVTGSGPVSLMANATQFLFGLLWPASIRMNLTAAYISASPQASSEYVVPSFWVAQRIGGTFRTLLLAQLIVIPVGALLTPIVFDVLQQAYGVGLEPGQLSAPTGLKIATLAVVMEKGLGFLPRGALEASVWAAVVGVVFELLLMVKRQGADGTLKARFWFVPIPAAFGFALILPASLNIAMATGAVLAALWRKAAEGPEGSFERYAAPIASGLIAGEAIIGSILMPALTMLLPVLERLLGIGG